MLLSRETRENMTAIGTLALVSSMGVVWVNTTIGLVLVIASVGISTIKKTRTTMTCPSCGWQQKR